MVRWLLERGAPSMARGFALDGHFPLCFSSEWDMREPAVL